MKNTEKIKKGLQHCIDLNCDKCDYDGLTFDKELNCEQKLLTDALELIIRLEKFVNQIKAKPVQMYDTWLNSHVCVLMKDIDKLLEEV